MEIKNLKCGKCGSNKLKKERGDNVIVCDDCGTRYAFTLTEINLEGDSDSSAYPTLQNYDPFEFSIRETTLERYVGNREEVKIPYGVEKIQEAAFRRCEMTSVKIPDSVVEIGPNAFEMCRKLVRVEIPNSVNKIRNDAFHGCRKLERVEIPDSVTRIGRAAFMGCDGLKSVRLPNSRVNIGKEAFWNDKSSLERVYFYGSMDEWCRITFTWHDSNPMFYAHNLYINGELVKDLVIPNTVTEIKNYAFCGGDFTSVTIPSSITSIGEYAFGGCTGFTSIEIPDSVTLIEQYAFYECDNLVHIDMPSSVSHIGQYALCCRGTFTSISYGDTMAMWQKINVPTDWKRLNSVYVVDCVDGRLTNNKEIFS